MKKAYKFLFVLAFGLSALSALLSLGSGLTVAGGVITMVMYSADWFSLILAMFTTLVTQLAGAAWFASWLFGNN